MRVMVMENGDGAPLMDMEVTRGEKDVVTLALNTLVTMSDSATLTLLGKSTVSVEAWLVRAKGIHKTLNDLADAYYGHDTI